MPFFRKFKKEFKFHTAYDHFETMISGILLVIISIIIVYSLILVVITIVEDFHTGVYFAQAGAIKDTFGLILGLLILIEFNHSIALGMRSRSGVLQVRVIILLAIIVIARKLILLNYEKVAMDTLLGLGGLALSLGALYWLLTDVEHRRRPSAPPERTAGEPTTGWLNAAKNRLVAAHGNPPREAPAPSTA
ncbi:MAG: phosphate-starvation-inducible PsiE family protein, partial [Stellaceae bacterium]